MNCCVILGGPGRLGLRITKFWWREKQEIVQSIAHSPGPDWSSGEWCGLGEGQEINSGGGVQYRKGEEASPLACFVLLVLRVLPDQQHQHPQN